MNIIELCLVVKIYIININDINCKFSLITLILYNIFNNNIFEHFEDVQKIKVMLFTDNNL